MLPEVIVNEFPVGLTSAEAPGTTLFKLIFNLCPVTFTGVKASNIAVPWAIYKAKPVNDKLASAVIVTSSKEIFNCWPTKAVSGSTSTSVGAGISNTDSAVAWPQVCWPQPIILPQPGS